MHVFYPCGLQSFTSKLNSKHRLWILVVLLALASAALVQARGVPPQILN
ncbi:hypothetical protein A2U01_0007785, partial [Trifolium medium]|nr:hypothetical protein [Trifolium medium]